MARTRSTSTAAPAAKAAPAAPARGGSAKARAIVAAIGQAMTDGGIRDRRERLAEAIASAIVKPLKPLKAASGSARWAAMEAAGEGVGYVILPAEAFDERKRAAKGDTAGAWLAAGGHKTVAAFVSRWVAPAVPAVATWWSAVTTCPVPAGALSTLPDGGYVAFIKG